MTDPLQPFLDLWQLQVVGSEGRSTGEGLITRVPRNEGDAIIQGEFPLTFCPKRRCGSVGQKPFLTCNVCYRVMGGGSIDGLVTCDGCRGHRVVTLEKIYGQIFRKTEAIADPLLHSFCSVGCPMNANCPTGFPVYEMLLRLYATIFQSAQKWVGMILTTEPTALTQALGINDPHGEGLMECIDYAQRKSLEMVNRFSTLDTERISDFDYGTVVPLLQELTTCYKDRVVQEVSSQLTNKWTALSADVHHSIDAQCLSFCELILQESSVHQTVGLLISNALDFKFGDLDIGKGLYPIASKLQHSCVPNCRISFDSKDNSIFLTAVRGIGPDEELTINYINPTEAPFDQSYAQRHWLLTERYQFICRCTGCQVELSMDSPERNVKRSGDTNDAQLGARKRGRN